MPVYLDKTTDQTIVRCDCCLDIAATDRADGVYPEGWASGNLWIDLSLSKQRQIPIAFCPACASSICDEEAEFIINRKPDLPVME